MPNISDIIQTIARQRGRGDTSPLILLRQLDGVPGERISHLPVDSELAQAWVALTGEPFRPHQAQALTALRRGEPVALSAVSADIDITAYLLLYAMLLADPHAAGLLLAPDETIAQATRAHLIQLNEQLPQGMRLMATLVGPERRPDHYARVVIATPETLHNRLLRHHDRAWSLFWPRLRIVILPDLQRYSGIAGAHMTDLLLRLQRIAAAHSDNQLLSILATVLESDNLAPALAALLGQPWRIIAADDGPREPTTLAVWRGSFGRLRESAELATTIRRQGYHVHIACGLLESALVAPIVGDIEGITWGPNPSPASVLIAAGYPGSISAVRRMVHSGHQAVILALGELPHEQALARQTEMLLSGPPTIWLAPAANAYVAAQHILCAASELPLTEDEVEDWGAQEIVARLVANGQLVDLPDPEVAWKPTDAAGDPYAEFSILASSGDAILARTEQGQIVGVLDPTGFERWTFPNAALPAGAGGFRVVARDEEAGSVTLRLESNSRRTYPLRRCQVSVREERDTRALAGGRRIGWGRVVVDEEIYGYREATTAAAPADRALQPPLTARWIAPACWFDITIGTQVVGQFVGWSLAAALALRALVSFTDVVPCYDHEARRLYLVDAQPGGSGLAAWVYASIEELLPLAYDVALACRNDPLLDPLSRADMDWLLALLGRTADAAPADRPREADTARTPARVERAIRPELIEGPPPTTPRIILTPAPTEEEPPSTNQQRPLYDGDSVPADDRTQGKPSVPAGAGNRDPTRSVARPAPASAPPRSVEPPKPEPGRAESSLDQRRPSAARRAEPSKPERPQGRPSVASQPAQAPRTPSPRRGSEPPTRPASPPPRDTTASRKPVDDSDLPPDPAALIERLRRQREQREARQEPRQPRQQPATDQPDDIEPRFNVGERIFCLPYGDGVVRDSRIEGGRELLTVAFPNHGELTIDPAVSLVRKLEDAPEEDDLL